MSTSSSWDGYIPWKRFAGRRVARIPDTARLFLLKMVRRFAKIDPVDLRKLEAHKIDPIALKMEWMEMCDRAEAEMIQLADTHIDMPIGVAFVDENGEPGWIGRNPDLRIHYPSMRGCWPVVHVDAPGE